MKNWKMISVSGVAATTVVLALTGAAIAAPSGTARLAAVGLTADQKLVTFTLQGRGDRAAVAAVRGLVGDHRLIGIDRRVQDGLLYGVGNAGGVYTLRSADGRATKVSQLTVALSGAAFGVDFNPAADRLRVISDTGQNLRHNVNAGGTTIADTTMTYPPATTAAGGVTGVAYTNNDLDADTGTTLYDIDTTLDQVVLQSPANSGQLSPVGKLGVDAAGDAGFDIYASVRKGTATDAVGFAVLTVGSRTGIYRISLVTGRAHHIGTAPKARQLTDLAVGLDRNSPGPVRPGRAS
ncbi:DUF4394 domain-containing protein [Jidongwangia harbinensis]|uniref:DUF4394 domain-containing protein n=1 Tax=Jidongwangia harbinensis TaxID=2878561 RepID=UPI001CD9E4B3|nr:DUF4394 domain-containing protein [Jidongwangia harbinensis]MCA2211689.1 DUF4394 domain-containing protein [Jidongwangia harbinensis]